MKPIPPLEVQRLARNVHEILILCVLREAPRHGYQIALEIEERSGGFFAFNHGTLYPILHELEKEGLIDGSWNEGTGRRKRKEYALTPGGEARLGERIGEWGELYERLSAFVVESAQVRPRAASDQR